MLKGILKIPQFVIILFMLLPAVSNAAERCAVLYKSAEGRIESKMLPSLSLSSLAAEQPFILPLEAPQGVVSIQCGREALALGPNDYKPLLAGYTLSIVAGERVGVLEAVNGRLRFRMIEGTMTEQESEQGLSALNAAQKRFDEGAKNVP